MSVLRSASAAVAVFAFVTASVALAQTPAPSTPSTTSTAADDVSKWSIKQWNAAKAKWAKEKEKWADCEKQSKEQKLSGKKSWSFLASCMTS
ncbi:MAG TPA: hypothetical protein VIY51_23265 [Xanthobacteraceae bacterium]